MEESAAPVSFGRVLKNRQFCALWLALLVSSFGDWLALLALFSYIAFRLHGTPSQISWMLISFTLPAALFGPLGGVFVDRWNIKRTMIASDLIRTVLAALLAFSTDLYQIYFLVFTLSFVSCFFLPAQTVAIPLMVRKEELLVANSINAQTIQLIRVISPAVAGALVAWAGHKICFYIDSLSFVISAALLSTITLHRDTTEANKGIGSLPRELVEGLRFIGKHRAILFLTISMTAAILAVGAFDAVIVVYVRDILSADSRLFGVLISLVAVGTILGALLIGKFGQRWSRLYLVVLGILGIGINVLILAALSSAVATLICSFGLGLSVACVLIPSQTLMQEESPQSMLGRVSSTSMSLMTAAQLGSFLVAGTVANWLGIRNLYYLVGLTLILISIFAYGYKRVTRISEGNGSSGQATRV
jgi:DHA3 family macrolide efflux protein-like MFS transporter